MADKILQKVVDHYFWIDDRLAALEKKMNFKWENRWQTNITLARDFTYHPLLYPLYIVVLNRIVKSPLTRAHQKASFLFKMPGLRLTRDLFLILRMYGPRALYLGTGVAALDYFTTKPLFFGKNEDAEYEHPWGYYVFMISTALTNPFQFLISRMQMLDNPNILKSWRSFKVMFKQHGFPIIYKGALPLFTSQVYLYVSMEWCKHFMSQPNEERTIKDIEYLWPAFFFGAAVLTHPFVVLATKLYCGGLTHPRQMGIYNNSLYIMQKIVKQRGPRALWAGFGPALFLYAATYFPTLLYLTQQSAIRIKQDYPGLL